MSSQEMLQRWGPSPRGRGNHVFGCCAVAPGGAIPAWAGEPPLRHERRPACGGHPRVGGGTRPDGVILLADPGPSPRGRGNRPHLPCAALLSGPSPRGRGNRNHHALGHRLFGATPRGRENHLFVQRGNVGPGPSPRGRGNLSQIFRRCPDAGAIPAWAGELLAVSPNESWTRGHPRVGGGTLWHRLWRGVTGGPSPRGRGNRQIRQRRRGNRGAIPAWAGEPASQGSNTAARWGHPRVGGGTYVAGSLSTLLAGPSPRGRGNPR